MIPTKTAAAMSIRFCVPMMVARNSGTTAPASVPMLAPLAINAKIRGACALEKTSDIRLQNTEMWNNENTLIHT